MDGQELPGNLPMQGWVGSSIKDLGLMVSRHPRLTQFHIFCLQYLHSVSVCDREREREVKVSGNSPVREHWLPRHRYKP